MIVPKALELDKDYVKARQRRALSYEKKDMLDEAVADYRVIASGELGGGSASTKSKIAQLENDVKERNEKLQAEMLGKLKDLGNSVLGKFGMSVDNFKVEKDENTGSYSVNFQR